jgi:hypothetical protein
MDGEMESGPLRGVGSPRLRFGMNLLLDLENNGNGEKFGSVTWGNVLHVISLFDAIITAFSFGSETNSEKVIKLFN